MIISVRSIFLLSFLLVSLRAYSQLGTGPEKSVLNHLQKHRWEKADQQLKKLTARDSANSLVFYLYARYYFERENPSYNVDSCAAYSRRALTSLQTLTQKTRDKMEKLEIDSTIILALKKEADAVAFERSKILNTEEGFMRFISAYSDAEQVEEAVRLRDEVAFVKAQAENTYEAFHRFLQKYPNAAQAARAKTYYEQLLFEAQTRDKRLSSYQLFLQQHPETPFKNKVNQEIFELFTVSGEPERFIAYLQKYPNTPQAKKATNILFHLLNEDDRTLMLNASDSLRRIAELNQNYLVPFLKNDRFGFIDQDGREVLPPVIRSLHDEYKCGAVEEDFIIADGQMLARNGAPFFSGEIDQVDDLGAGILKVFTDSCVRVLHKSGYTIGSCVKDVKNVGNRFIAIKNDKDWQLYSLAGRRLYDESWENIDFINGLLVFKKNDHFFPYTLEDFGKMIDEQKFIYAHRVDDISPLPNGLLLIKNEGKVAVWDNQLQSRVPTDFQAITPSAFGLIIKSRQGMSIHDVSRNKRFDAREIVVSNPWVIVKTNKFQLLNTQTFKPSREVYDSITVHGAFALGARRDSVHLHFNDSVFLRFPKPVNTVFLPGKDLLSFIVIESGGKKTVYDNKGKNYFTMKSSLADAIQYAGEGYFIVSKKEKKGLVNEVGKNVLPIEYDAVGTVQNGLVTLLKNMRFGLYATRTRTVINPQYDKNINTYNSRLLTTYYHGASGFINMQNKPVGKFEYDEIRYWNDSIAITRKGETWMLLNVDTFQPVLSGIQHITLFYDTPEEKIAIVTQGGLFGVISNKRGVIIPITFTDLVNIGTDEFPLYFTEKHVTEASVFVVIYYNKNGKFLRREVYEDAEVYESIYCSEN